MAETDQTKSLGREEKKDVVRRPWERTGAEGGLRSGGLSPHRSRRTWHRLLIPLILIPLVMVGLTSCGSSSTAGPYSTTLNYVTRFYPLYIISHQEAGEGVNDFVGPATMGPEFAAIVAPNDDTVYTAAFVDLGQGPQILTIPKTNTSSR